MLNLYFYFLQFLLKIEICEKRFKDKSSGEQPKLTSYVIRFLLFCVIVKIFQGNCQNQSIFAMLAWFTYSTLGRNFLPL